MKLRNPAVCLLLRAAASLLWLLLPQEVQYLGFDYNFYLDAPAFLEVISPEGRKAGVGIAANVPKVTATPYPSGRLRYKFSFRNIDCGTPKKWGSSCGNVWVAVIYKAGRMQEDKLRFWAERSDGFLYPEREISISVLPWRKGARPQKTKINIELVSAMLLGRMELKELISTYADIGVNMVNQNWYWWNGVPDVDRKYYRFVSDQLHSKGIESLIGGRPGAYQGLSESDKASLANGVRSSEVACPSILLDPKNRLLEKIEIGWVKDTDADGIFYCNEYAALNGNTLGPSICFDERCAKNFRNLTGRKTKSSRLWHSHPEEWISFRCTQNAAIASRIRAALKKHNSSANLYLYSAPQSEYHMNLKNA